MDIKDLTKEQIEEAKACKTTEERINFFKKHNISLPDEFLDKVNGGEIVPPPSTNTFPCPKCSGYLVPTGRERPGEYFGDLWPDKEFRCNNGHVFWLG